MGAREKLNQVFAFGCVLLACVLGAWAESWIVFLLVLVGLAATSVYLGGIRAMRRG